MNDAALVRELLEWLGDRYALDELADAIIERHGRPVWLAVVRARIDIDRDRARLPRIGESDAAFARRRGRAKRQAPRDAPAEARFLPADPRNGRPTCEWCGGRRRFGRATCNGAGCLDLEREYMLSTGRCG